MDLNVTAQEVEFGVNINDVVVPEHLKQRYHTNHESFDIVFEKGLVPSQSIMLCGTPGAGKTTIMLELANGLTKEGDICVFNTNEESAYQVAMSAKRLGLKDGFLIGQESHLPTLLKKLDKLGEAFPNKQIVLIQDSLQTLDDGHFKSGRITTSTYERSLKKITEWTKTPNTIDRYPISIVIGQVTKDGKSAGSNKLRHMVDSIVHLNTFIRDNHPWDGCRRLHVEKNRFGCSGISAYMKMDEAGFLLQGTSDDLA